MEFVHRSFHQEYRDLVYSPSFDEWPLFSYFLLVREPSQGQNLLLGIAGYARPLREQRMGACIVMI